MGIENNKVLKFLHSKVLPGCALSLFLINQQYIELLYIPTDWKLTVNYCLSIVVILLLMTGGWTYYLTFMKEVLTNMFNIKIGGKNES